MNVWIFHHYATPPSLNGFTRPYFFAKELKKLGVDTTIFAASYLHFAEKNLLQTENLLEDASSGVPFVFLKTPSYKTKLARIYNMAMFYFKLFDAARTYAKKQGTPDVIIASSPHPFTMIAGIKIARIFDIPCICEVRDLWPEAVFMATKIKSTSILGKFLLSGERWIYHNSDSIIFTKEGDSDYIKERKWDSLHGGDIDLNKCFYINNGVDIKSFNYCAKNNILLDPDLESDKKRIIYTGAIRQVNNVDNLLDTAKLLKKETDLEFLIYGEGNRLSLLRKRIVDEKIPNVKLKGFIEKNFIPFVLSKSFVNILNYSQNQYNWSRGNSSNKLFDYMASGKPIISTVKMGYCLLEKYKCGFSLEKDTPEDLAKTILRVKNMQQCDYDVMCRNARIAASEFDFEVLAQRLYQVIQATLREKN